MKKTSKQNIEQNKLKNPQLPDKNKDISLIQ